jgi:hypothetical protein
MRRITTMMSSAGAAALTTLAVTVAVPAIGDEPGTPPTTPDALATCLRAHGVDGAPDGGAALKPWLAERLADGDAAVRRALGTCAPPRVVGIDGPSEQQLRSCFKDHGIDVPGDDPAALKRWIAEHHDEAATATAMKACDIGMVTKSAGVGCGKDGPGDGAMPAKPEDTTGAAEAPTTHSAVPAGT